MTASAHLIAAVLLSLGQINGPAKPMVVQNVPLTIEWGDVNCSVRATTPEIEARAERGNVIGIELWTATCPGGAPEEPFGFVATVRIADCTSRKDISLAGDGQLKIERWSATVGDGPPRQRATNRSTKAEFYVAGPLSLSEDVTFRIHSSSSKCRGSVTMPHAHVAALHAWERLPASTFGIVLPEAEVQQ